MIGKIESMAQVVSHFNKHEQIGPFLLKISRKGFFKIYEVDVDDVTILKYGSRPGFYDMCMELSKAASQKLITTDQYLEAREAASLYLRDNLDVMPKFNKAKNGAR